MAEKTTTNKENLTEDSHSVENTENQEQPNPDQFLKDFNWHNYEEGIDPIDYSKLEEFESLVKDNFVDTLTDEVVEGVVVNISDRDAIIDINAKSEVSPGIIYFSFTSAICRLISILKSFKYLVFSSLVVDF